MKLKYVVTILIITILSCKERNGITFTISNVKEIDFEGKKFQLINTKLNNNTKDTLKYWRMSCSYKEFYFLYNNDLFFKEHDCDKNIPIIDTLLPNENKEVQLYLRKSNNRNYSNIKIGFFLYKVKKDKDFDIKQLNLKSNLLTSNQIDF